MPYLIFCEELAKQIIALTSSLMNFINIGIRPNTLFYELRLNRAAKQLDIQAQTLWDSIKDIDCMRDSQLDLFSQSSWQSVDIDQIFTFSQLVELYNKPEAIDEASKPQIAQFYTQTHGNYLDIRLHLTKIARFMQLPIHVNGIHVSPKERKTKVVTALATILKESSLIQSIDLGFSMSHFSPPPDHTDAMIIIEALKTNTSLREINLSCCKINDESAATIATILEKNTSLQILDLSYNQIQLAGMLAIATGLQNNDALQSFAFYDNRLGESDIMAILNQLKANTSLVRISSTLYHPSQDQELTRLCRRNFYFHNLKPPITEDRYRTMRTWLVGVNSGGDNSLLVKHPSRIYPLLGNVCDLLRPPMK